MLLYESEKGGKKEQPVKGAYKRLYIDLVILAAWLSCAILFSAKVSAHGLMLTNQIGEEVEQSVLKSTHIDLQVRGMLAFVELEQVYQNPTLTTLNGRYQFPLPENSAVFHMEMRLDSRVIVGEIKEKQQATAIYQAAQKQGHKAALVDNQQGNLFITHVANIEPGQEVTIKLQFQFALKHADGVFSLRLPTAVAARYSNQFDESQTEQVEWLTAHDFLPSNILTSHRVENKITTNIDVDLGFDLEAITSPTHRVSVLQTDNTGYHLFPSDSHMVANRDLELRFKPYLIDDVSSQVFYEQVDDEHYFKVIMLPPSSEFMPYSLPRELVFVIDTSGSMGGTSMEQAKKALVLALESLNADDQFNIIAFDHEINMFRDQSVAATYSELNAAKRFIAGLQAGGGTEINLALTASFDGQYDATRVRQVILLTDGAIDHPDSVLALVNNRRADSKLFAVGIGSAANGHLMTMLAKIGKGESLFINNLETITSQVALLNNKLANPALQNIRVLNDSGLPIEHALPVADLYFSSPLVAYFKLDKNIDAIQLVGDNSQGKYLSHVLLNGAVEGKGIARAYAKEQLNTLDLVKNKQLITDLAIKHGLLTPFTSFVAVEAYFGDVADKSVDAPNMAVKGSAMPQASGNNDSVLILGLILLALGFLLLSWEQKNAQ
jgi:Ca-activated chloride channel family protein